MIDFDSVYVQTAEIDGRWIAATNTSPYFCFEAESEETALHTAAAALTYLREVVSNLEQIEQQEERVPANPNYHRGHRVPARELAAA